jgi:hypothetical protein
MNHLRSFCALATSSALTSAARLLALAAKPAPRLVEGHCAGSDRPAEPPTLTWVSLGVRSPALQRANAMSANESASINNLASRVNDPACRLRHTARLSGEKSAAYASGPWEGRSARLRAGRLFLRQGK